MFPTVFVAYPADQNKWGDNAMLTYTQFYPSLSKFIDGYREKVKDRVGTRDGTLLVSLKLILLQQKHLSGRVNIKRLLLYIA
ncbi:MAG: hypothetical protein LKF70_02170 [Prevotella sp.]|nr:hypothetical protein [Prevotella sp.]MCH4240827.1 hypothetical protein [Prevotella sp.]